MFLVYSCSTFYHFAQKEKTKSWLQIADHISIYFLIAGTYTPLMIKSTKEVGIGVGLTKPILCKPSSN
jgi:channel protein (hemolysin III family)